MTKTYYVVSTNTAENMTSKTKTISLSERDPNATGEDAMVGYMGVFTTTLEDEAEFASYEVGTKVTMTLTPAE